MTTDAMPLIVARGIDKSYPTPAGRVEVLKGLDLEVHEGEMLAILGASGVGKSTLLHILGTLDHADAGSLTFAGEDLARLPEPRLREFRNAALGFVFQFHHLLPEFTALENVMMPLLIARQDARTARGQAQELLEELGLGDRLDHRPGALSGGEQQRVAVARALVRSPRALLADEPTGNLDRQTGDRLHALVRRLNRERPVTVVVVTHNEGLAEACDRRLRLEAGTLVAA
jgi:lipoprotein-releasing system ATP-binding protein